MSIFKNNNEFVFVMVNVDVVLVEPEIAGNVGAIARAMKNFDFENLVIINPKCNIKSSEAVCRAKNAQDIISNSIVVNSFDDLDYDIKIGTTGKLGSDYNIPRSPLTPDELAEKIKDKVNSAIFFGRESHGLTNEEISEMDFLVNIPSSDDYGILNLSHAVSIILYELFKVKQNFTLKKNKFKQLENNDKNLLLSIINEKLDKISFETESKRKTQKILWKKIVGKAMLTKREGFSLMGFFRRI